MRRKPGQLLDLEAQILGVAIQALAKGDPDVHGFAIAQDLADQDRSRRLTAHGTLYKALGRMEAAGLLESRWEEPEAAEAAGRPRRRLYRVTLSGQGAFAAHEATGVAGVQFGQRPVLG